MKAIQRTFYYARKYWLTALGALLSMLFVNAANLYSPQLLRQLIDDGISAFNMKRVWIVAGLLVLVAMLRGLFNFLQGYLSEKTSQGIAFELRNVIFEKLQKLSFSYHDQAQTGKLMSRMTSDVELVRTFTGNGLIQLLSAVLLLIGTLGVLFSMNALLTVIFLLMIPPIAIVFAIFVRRLMPLSRTVQQKLDALNTVLQENLAGIRIVKAFARESYEEDRFLKRNQDFLSRNIDLLKIFSTFFPLIFFFANLGVVGVVWVGGLTVISQKMTLGELVAFIGYQGFFLMPIFMLGFIGSAMSRAEASAQRIFEVVDAVSEVRDRPNAKDLPILQGKVEFKQVSFRYSGSDNNIIQDISFTVKPNQTVAILGKTGSGKSSIINLIPRFYDVSSGSVLVDDCDVRDVKVDSLRSQIGIVLQEVTLFSGTIRENIAYGRPDASQEEVTRVARIAQVEEFIKELPQGYETVVGERGVGLSGGQKQRIAIARALLMNPKILIMDDSTSSVDTETEYRIQAALQELRHNKTTFIIAQRISTVRTADLILLLDQGKLVAQGTHQELLDCCEIYAEILATQLGGQAELESAIEESLL